jgi:hypothetical protein
LDFREVVVPTFVFCEGAAAETGATADVVTGFAEDSAAFDTPTKPDTKMKAERMEL